MTKNILEAFNLLKTAQRTRPKPDDPDPVPNPGSPPPSQEASPVVPTGVQNPRPAPEGSTVTLPDTNISAPAAPRAGNRPSSTTQSAVHSLNSKKAIQRMQIAIQDFIDHVVGRSTGLASQPRSQGPRAAVPVSNQPKDRFNEFLTEQYANKAVMKGKETLPGGKDPSDLIQQNTLLDTMQRIGRSKSERDMDGVWSFRTQNALENIAAFAEALIKLTADFGVPAKFAKDFTMKDLQQLMARVPKDSAIRDSVNFKNGYLEESARIITNLLDKLKVFYTNYQNNITNNPIYFRKIVGDEPLFSVTQGKTDITVIPDHLKNLDKSQLYIAITAGGKDFRVPVNVLEDQKQFFSFLTNTMGFTADELTKEMPSILKSFSNQISQRMKEIQPKQTA